MLFILYFGIQEDVFIWFSFFIIFLQIVGWKWFFVYKKTCQDDNIKIGILIVANCSKAIKTIEVIKLRRKTLCPPSILDWYTTG